MIKEDAKERYFQALLDASIVSRSDPEGNFTDINENFTKVTGFTKEDVIGKNHTIMRHPDADPTVIKDMWEIIRSKQVFRGRLLSKNKDGSDFWSELTIVPLLDKKSGEIIEYMGIRHDLTEFMNAERKEKKRKDLEKIAKAKDSFLVLFTHELKTPLNAIINFSNYLVENIDKAPKEKQKKLAKKILFNSRKMLQDVIQLLDLSKLKSDKLTYRFFDFDIKKSIKEVVESNSSLLEYENVNITTSMCRSKECIVYSDNFRFKQILTNILSNAIKYSNGKVSLHVERKLDVFVVSVEDNGDGIKDKEKIFELFEQLDSDLITRGHKGTGVGLSFVKLLCAGLDIEYKLSDSKSLGGLKFELFIKAKQ